MFNMQSHLNGGFLGLGDATADVPSVDASAQTQPLLPTQPAPSLSFLDRPIIGGLGITGKHLLIAAAAVVVTMYVLKRQKKAHLRRLNRRKHIEN